MNKLQSTTMIEIDVRNARVLNCTCILENNENRRLCYHTFLLWDLIEQQLYYGRNRSI